MSQATEDLRILRLAQMYEKAYEAFVAEVAAGLADDETRRRLAPLLPDKDEHALRISREAERIEGSLGARDEPALVAAALADVVDVERAARELYHRQADRAHDPRVAALFRDLAREESRHLRAAEDALDHHVRRAGLRPPEAGQELDEEPLPLWEA